MEKKRSVGIVIAGVIDLILGFYLCGYCFYSGISLFFESKKYSPEAIVVSILLAALVFLIGTCFIFLGFSIIKLTWWNILIRGHVACLVLLIFEFLGSFLQYQSNLNILCRISLMIYFSWTLFFFIRPKVKEQFK
jgi:hypothetical protein